MFQVAHRRCAVPLHSRRKNRSPAKPETPPNPSTMEQPDQPQLVGVLGRTVDQIDEDEVKTVLRADEYDGDSAAGGHGGYGRGSWPV